MTWIRGRPTALRRPVRRIVAVVVVAAVASTGLPLLDVAFGPLSRAAANSSDDAYMINRINEVRASKGVRVLKVDSHLNSVASHWTDVMASENRLYHNPNLGSDVNERDWRKLGENVGRTTGSAQDVQKAFEESPGHYRNIVDPDFNYIGLVSKRVDGTLWVTQVFMKLDEAPPPPPTTVPPAPKVTVPPTTAPPPPPPPTTPPTTAPPTTTTAPPTTTTTAPPTVEEVLATVEARRAVVRLDLRTLRMREEPVARQR